MTRLIRPDGGPGYQGNVVGRFVADHPRAAQVILVLAAVGVLAGFAFVPSCDGAEKPSLLSDAAPLALGAMADLGGTEWALLHPSLHEVNALGSTRRNRILLKTGATAGALVITRRLRATGRPRAAAWVKWGTFALQAGAGAYAVHKGLQARRKP